MIVFLYCIGIFSCNCFTSEDDPLNIERFDKDDIAININGYYYDKTSTSEGDLFNIYFFYMNGTVRYAGSYAELPIVSREWTQADSRTNWGIFDLNTEEFLFEKWYPSSGGPAKTYVREGEILTDSSFHITRSYRIVDGEQTENSSRDEFYFFKAFSPKPDSLNAFTN